MRLFLICNETKSSQIFVIKKFVIEIDESQYIALFVANGLSKSFSQLIVSILSFLNIFFNRFCPVEKCGVSPHCLYRDPSVTLNFFPGGLLTWELLNW